MAWALINEEEFKDSEFPLKPQAIAKYQQKDKALRRQVKKSTASYGTMKLEDAVLITYKDKICVPAQLQ